LPQNGRQQQTQIRQFLSERLVCPKFNPWGDPLNEDVAR